MVKIVKDFEATNPTKKYKSDLTTFIRESKLEDFSGVDGETIFVSTIHKAKGKEFDNVFLMLDNFHLGNDAEKRLLYVALTRAKNNITIHLNSNFLGRFSADNLARSENNEKHLAPNQAVMQLSFRDVWLDYFRSRQYLVSQLRSGDSLSVHGNECLDTEGRSVLRFSREFVKQAEWMKAKRYEFKRATVNFIVYWQKEGTEEEIKIVLPELLFERE